MSISKVKLVVSISSPSHNETMNLEGEEFIFGRSSSSNVHLNDPAFSRSHFKLSVDHKTLKLSDLGSSNGTFINGAQVSPVNSEVLNADDLITVNNTEMTIRITEINWPSEDEDATVILKNIPDFKKSTDALSIDHLSEEIVKEANLRVEQILDSANREALEIIEEARLRSDKMIADKQALADQYLEKQVLEKKALIKKDLEIEKNKKLEDINQQFESDRQKIYDDLQMQALKIEKDHANRIAELNDSLKGEIQNIAQKRQEFLDLDQNFQAEVEKKKIEMDAQIVNQKLELARLVASQEEEKEKQIKLMEAQFENKKFQLKSELDELELKVSTSKKEFSSLYDNYNNQKESQVKALEKLSSDKDQLISDIKKIGEDLLAEKKKNEQFAKDAQTTMSATQVEIDKILKLKSEFESSYKTSKDKLAEVQKSISANEATVAAQEKTLKEKKEQTQLADVELKKMTSEKEAIVLRLAPLKAELTDLIKQNEAAARQNHDLKSAHDKDVTGLKASFLQQKKDLEEEMNKRKADEEERLQNITRQELNQINKMKEDSLRIVLDLEDSITKELSNATSKVFATTIGMTKFREIAPDFEKSIRASLQAGVLKLLKNELTPADPLKKKTLSSTQKTWKPMAVGMGISFLVFGVLPFTYQYVKEQNDPVRKQMEAEAARAAAAPIIRKFEPVKVSKLGQNLVESVIYTENFYETVTQEKYRSGLMKEGSVYMYKQWKIDEEKSIQAYSMILSLVDALHEKAGKIDADYEKRDIAKMTVLEKETMKKLEKILGNEVRIEAAMKFHNRYYEDYVMNVLPAQVSVGNQ